MAIVLNGTTQYAYRATAPSTTDFVWAGWFRRDSDSGAVEAWVGLDSGGGADEALVYVSAADGLNKYVTTGGASTAITPVVSTWYWVMFRYAGGVFTLRTSADGTGAWQSNDTETASAVAFGNLTLGARYGTGTAQGFAPLTCGLLKVWSGATLPNDTEVLAERTSRNAIVTTGLWATYQFKSGALGTDSSGNGRTLTQVATPTFSSSKPSDLATITVTHIVRASGGDYTTLAAWESAQQRDLVAADEIARAAVGAFNDLSTTVSIAGWTADASRHIIVEAENTAARAKLPWDATAYVLQMTNAGSCISVFDGRPRLIGLQLEVLAYGFNFAQYGVSSADYFEAHECVVRYVGNASNNGNAWGFNNAYGGYRARNCVVMNFDGTGGGTNRTAFQNSANTGGRSLDNCMAINCQIGFCGLEDYSPVVARNCLTDDRGLSGAVGFAGTYTTGTEYNASDDATAPGTNSRTGQTFTFVDAEGGNYRLASGDVGAKGFGTNLSADPTYPFSIDFDGLTRTVPWDIGALIAEISRAVNYSTSGPAGKNRFIVKKSVDGSRMIINR